MLVCFLINARNIAKNAVKFGVLHRIFQNGRFGDETKDPTEKAIAYN